MKKKDFCAALLSRFISLDGEARYHFLSCLLLAESECKDETSEKFDGWTETLVEALFPEVIGDLHIRGRGKIL